MTDISESAAESSVARSRRISGWMVVVGLLVIGAAATAVMFIYWDLHTKPFRPLTEAIGRAYKYSLPKVEGGRHKRGPMTLRVALRIPFSPEVDQYATDVMLDEICRLIVEHQDLAGYERVQIHFFQLRPEEAAQSKKFEFTPEEVVRRSGVNQPAAQARE